MWTLPSNRERWRTRPELRPPGSQALSEPYTTAANNAVGPEPARPETTPDNDSA